MIYSFLPESKKGCVWNCQLVFIKYIENALSITMDTSKASFKNMRLKIILGQHALRMTSVLGSEMGTDQKKWLRRNRNTEAQTPN